MAKILSAAPVVEALRQKTLVKTQALASAGITPVLGILRVGEKSADLSYERGVKRRCGDVGIEVRVCALPADASQEAILDAVGALNADPAVSGILMFRPLPRGIDERRVCEAILPEKDVDGAGLRSLSGVFSGCGLGFASGISQAAMEMLHYYEIPVAGKEVCVIGRSLVVGRPAAMLLLAEDATVTICHSRTRDLKAQVRRADIVITGVGRAEMIGEDWVRPGQVLIDIGLSYSPVKQKLCGDVDLDAVAPIVDAVTPVPGGVGAVTSMVLLSHVAEAADRRYRLLLSRRAGHAE